MRSMKVAFALIVVAMTGLAMFDPYGGLTHVPSWLWYPAVATPFALYLYAWTSKRPLRIPIVIAASAFVGFTIAPPATAAFPSLEPVWIIFCSIIPLAGTFLIRSFRPSVIQP